VAVITEVAAAIRSYSVGGVDVTVPYPESSTPPFGDGIVLMPWPNRVKDGTWQLHGATQQLAITEPERNSALHGLLRFSPYSVVEQSVSAITLAATVFPQNGYPFQLDTTVTYELDDAGLTVTHTVHNVSDAEAPVAIGSHPFFTIGGVPTEDLVLTLSAATRFEVDARLNPVREVSVEGTMFDLRVGHKLADVYLDDAFGGLIFVDGVSRHWLTAPDGRKVEIWQDDNFRYVQGFTTREFPKVGGMGLAVAVEPMTAPPDAFNSGQDLHWLAPDEHWSVRWGVRYLPAPGA
jgi:aldose 1-epimerase